ncbi:MAG: hypothetical protein WCH79_09840 [Planctomycetia bacterium]
MLPDRHRGQPDAPRLWSRPARRRIAYRTGERFLSTPLLNCVGMNGSSATNDFTI